MLETELEHHKAKLVAMERRHCSQVENMFFNGNNQRCIFGVKTVLSSFLVSTAWCDTFTWTEAKKNPSAFGCGTGKSLSKCWRWQATPWKEKFLSTGEGFIVCSCIQKMDRDFWNIHEAFYFFLFERRGSRRNGSPGSCFLPLSPP